MLTDEAAGLLTGLTGRIERVFASVTEVRDAALELAASARAVGRELRTADLAVLRPLVAAMLTSHQGFAAGAGVVLAPGVLADAPRHLEWWWATPAGQPSRLDVDLDPQSPEFYDYTSLPWYREPQRTGQRAITGPYVDYICTRQYTFTVSVPLLADARFAGVAAADILAEEVELLALPALARLPGPVALVSGNGRVIASNTTRALPGSLLTAGQASRDLWHGTSSLPWALRAEPVGCSPDAGAGCSQAARSPRDCGPGRPAGRSAAGPQR